MKKIALLLLSTLAFGNLMAQNIKVDSVLRVGPTNLTAPVFFDSVDAAQQHFSPAMLLQGPLSAKQFKEATPCVLSNTKATLQEGKYEQYSTLFRFQNSKHLTMQIAAKGPQNLKIFLNGEEYRAPQPLQPGIQTVQVIYLADTNNLEITLSTADSQYVTLLGNNIQKRDFTLEDNMMLRHYYMAQLSPSGKYAQIGISGFTPEGSSDYNSFMINTSDGSQIAERDFYTWMPTSDRYLMVKTQNNKRILLSIDPSTNHTEQLSENLPEGSFYMSPTEDFLIFNKEIKGPQKETGVYEILSPDDRQPGNRNRNQLLKFDLKSQTLQPLTFGSRSVYLNDISQDGKTILISFSRERLTQRPTTLTTICTMNLETLKLDTLVKDDGFVGGADFVPGTSKVLITGSPEAFNRIGCTLPQDLIPNQFDYQLYLLDINTKEVTPLTKNFNPSVKTVQVAKNGSVFFTAENADSVSLYQLDINTLKISQLQQPMEVLGNISVNNSGNTLLMYGTSACTSDCLYTLTLAKKKNSVQKLADLNAERMNEIELGTCQGFRFMSKNGYPLTGHYYLPAHFNKDKKYPVIVHYYGGCSPTARRFGGGSHYPAHYWNAMGYVVLIVNPGGASGFGQEWGARHVNTMGEGIAEDIIEATEWFANNNSFVNKDKIGCVSASYGGFMTQLLLTKTDLFATGISHAGISDHTSYWGEGYWGYSYSEVSAANSYPWNRKDLYVDRSPLFNADKIHKPILFTHGTSDTNVPIGESIQMYTALKLLGVPTAFIMVEGENHGIMDFTKRQLWINSMVAWFHKWLQDDDSWWNAIYTPKKL